MAGWLVNGEMFSEW